MDFQQAKRKKERGQTNEEFLNMVFKEAKDFDEITITIKQPNGIIETWFSQDGSLSIVGMLEVAKHQIINDMEG